MNSYVALLRGINVSGHKIIKMKELDNSISSLGFSNISTYLQSGNLVFQSELNDIQEIENQISHKIKSDFGFDIPIFIYTKAAFLKINSENPFVKNSDFDIKKIYTIFLKSVVDKNTFQDIAANTNYSEKMVLKENVIYMYYENGYGKTKVHNNFFEAKLKVVATTRNWNTVQKLESLLNVLS
jgi:uncharacterized protein (DUF1697 family)